jgi:hypothetical protein
MKFLQKKSIVEIPPVNGSVSDTLNVNDKVTNAPSMRLVEEMIANSPGGGGDGILTDSVIGWDGEEIPEGYDEIEGMGEVSDTWEVEDDTSFAPSIRLVLEKFSGIDALLDTLNGEVI